MGHIRVSHPTGRHGVVPICSRQIGRRASRYDPYGTLSLITGFASSLQREVSSRFQEGAVCDCHSK
ncbi:hypothetical protein CT690_01410 [Serratia plymuthica]|uniref:Uncharacterized protein n=1 Tax=Serratia plymuthica TaxID=82996 RepID=A0A318P628_SERPL|nr:hypothetical protein CT690_01410 [Serratia plymuthica]